MYSTRPNLLLGFHGCEREELKNQATSENNRGGDKVPDKVPDHYKKKPPGNAGGV